MIPPLKNRVHQQKKLSAEQGAYTSLTSLNSSFEARTTGCLLSLYTSADTSVLTPGVSAICSARIAFNKLLKLSGIKGVNVLTRPQMGAARRGLWRSWGGGWLRNDNINRSHDFCDNKSVVS